jgi:hypothetical protein
MATTVRISNRGRELLAQLSQEADTTMTEVLDSALESYRRQRFLEQAALAYDKLSTDVLDDYHRETTSLDSTNNDGLEPFAT